MNTGSGAHFATTHWSLILQAGLEGHPQATEALDSLCAAYWFPLYAFARRRGHSASDAADLTQSFFVRLLEKRTLERADPLRGRFRNFLLTMFQRYLISDHERNVALKRGGLQRTLSLDAMQGEDRYAACPVEHRTAESVFEREWALTLLNRAYQRLEKEYSQKGRAAVFEHCRPWLTGADLPAASPGVDEPGGLSEGAFRVAVHRMRTRFRELLRHEVALTLDDESSLEDEMRTLMSALA